MKKLITLLAVAGLVLAFAPAVQAQVVIPTPGVPYRLMFVTTSTTDATLSADITTYNTIADAEGDIVLASDWKVYGGTAAVGARVNTGALVSGDGGYSAAIDVPIYTLDGDRVAADNTALWTGIMENGLTLNTGGTPAFNQFAYTGCLPGGDAIAAGGSAFSGPLGDTQSISGALTTRVGGAGILVARKETYHPDANPIIALSGVIGGNVGTLILVE
jgi:hypothetical protein